MNLFMIGIFGLTAVTSQILELDEGSECTPLGGGQGTCRLLMKCATVGDYKIKNPPICSFKGMDLEPVVCCPDKQVSKSKAGLKVKKICEELETINQDKRDPKQTINIVGFTSQRASQPPVSLLRPPETPGRFGSFSTWGNMKGIYGVSSGTTVPPKENPFMALIGYCGSKKTRCHIAEVTWDCGGSLITPRYVLSAAHCAYSFYEGPAKWTRLGDLDIGSSKDDAMPVDTEIEEIILYPKYLNTQDYHDILLFKLVRKVYFNGYVLPICLQAEKVILQPRARISGWGRTGFVEGKSEMLLGAEVNIYNDTECKKLMFSETKTKSPLGHQPDIMFCAGLPEGGKDACLGDSGGPLFVNGSPKYPHLQIQVGIISYGKMCGLQNSPGVYTRVSYYIPWIEEVAFSDVTV